MFEDNIKELKELRKNNQKMVDREVDSFVKSLKEDINNKEYNDIINQPNYSTNGLLKKLGINKNVDILYMILIIFLIAFLGLININGYLFYLFGLIFFVAGTLIGFFVPGFGLIFLFTHGAVGYGIMISALLQDRFSIAELGDLSFNMKIYFGVIALLVVGGFIGVVLYNLSETLNKNKLNKLFSLIILGLALFLVGMIPLVRF